MREGGARLARAFRLKNTPAREQTPESRCMYLELALSEDKTIDAPATFRLCPAGGLAASLAPGADRQQLLSKPPDPPATIKNKRSDIHPQRKKLSARAILVGVLERRREARARTRTPQLTTATKHPWLAAAPTQQCGLALSLCASLHSPRTPMSKNADHLK